MNTADAFHTEPMTWEQAFEFGAQEYQRAADAASRGDFDGAFALRDTALTARELARELHDRMFR